ncbi:hypothetical protein [Saccharicrinis aurantiacus]|uniref:hypothetical protein n=1 Tax=Saccharicrinis aurantiacus TaxID=1849719 RepID=UPI00094FC722|nr:hypothetical protein [Saccharicrinis aurantiacus]
MKRYFVITHQSKDNAHLNVQDLLPAACTLITGIAVNAIVKQDAQAEEVFEQLSFPQRLITQLLQDDPIAELFYSYLRTRSTIEESKAFFESDILPEIMRVLSTNIVFSCFTAEQQELFNDSIVNLFQAQFTDYIYNDAKLFDKGSLMTDLDFTDFIAQQTLVFCYNNKDVIFKRSTQTYKQPEAYECGHISLLINGNSFLLRDYIITANRKVKHLSKEIIPFHEPLEVNSTMYTVFKSNKNNSNSSLSIRIYIEYETST